MPSITALWRYPVKSMAGEALDRARIVDGAIVGDRAWGVVDQATGRLLSAKRVGALLEGRARCLGGKDADGEVELALPGGYVGLAGTPATDAALSAWLGRAVALHRPTAGVVSTIEMDLVADDGGDDGVAQFQTRPGSMFDSQSPIHLVSTGTLAALDAEHGPGAGDPRRFRPNVVVGGVAALAELAWLEQTVRLGAVPARVRTRTERCVIVTRAQPALPQDRGLLRHLAQRHQVFLGLYLHPTTDGELAVGDPVVAP